MNLGGRAVSLTDILGKLRNNQWHGLGSRHGLTESELALLIRLVDSHARLLAEVGACLSCLENKEAASVAKAQSVYNLAVWLSAGYPVTE